MHKFAINIRNSTVGERENGFFRSSSLEWITVHARIARYQLASTPLQSSSSRNSNTWVHAKYGGIEIYWTGVVNVWGKRFMLPQLTHESFLTIDHSCKTFFWYLPNWTSTNLWCVVLYSTYSTTHLRSVEVQFGRYQKNILQEWSMVKNLSCVSCAAWNVFPINSLLGGTVFLNGFLQGL